MDVNGDIRKWRKSERVDLLERRMAISQVDFRRWNTSITHFLIQGFPVLRQMAVGFYWPFRGEVDARFAVRQLREHGAVAALPIVVGKELPLQFREWWPGAPMTSGAYNVPVPEGTTIVQPQALLIPPLGFDIQGYRLGYGSGYFDRTLACMTPQPLKIAVAFELSRIATIHPQRHDVAMDFIVTEAGIHGVTRNGLQCIGPANEAAALSWQLVRERGYEANHSAQDLGAKDPPNAAGES